MGKTRDLFKIIRDSKGTLHVKIDKIKDREIMHLQKQEILRRIGNTPQKNYTKKIL